MEAKGAGRVSRGGGCPPDLTGGYVSMRMGTGEGAMGTGAAAGVGRVSSVLIQTSAFVLTGAAVHHTFFNSSLACCCTSTPASLLCSLSLCFSCQANGELAFFFSPQLHFCCQRSPPLPPPRCSPPILCLLVCGPSLICSSVWSDPQGPANGDHCWERGSPSLLIKMTNRYPPLSLSAKIALCVVLITCSH